MHSTFKIGYLWHEGWGTLRHNPTDWTADKMGLDYWKSQRDFSFLYSVKTGSGAYPASCTKKIYRGFFTSSPDLT
jgi:hypothetical protein